MGVPPVAAPVPRQLSPPYQVAGQRQGGLQDRGQQGRLQAVGASQEQAGHELRDHGQSSQILLPEGNPGQGGRTETGLPVR